MIVKYKCCVQSCKNVVPRYDVMCKECFEKYLDSHYYVLHCYKCKSIIDFIPSKDELPDYKRVIERKCEFCVISENLEKFPKEEDSEPEESDEIY